MVSDEHVFVTGGAGFIGTAIATQLIGNNRITIFDNFKRNALANAGSYLRDHPNLNVVRGDVRDSNLVSEAILSAQPSIIIHCAAIAGIDTVIMSPVSTLETNLLGTAHVLNASTNLPGLKRFVIFSTSEVFGQVAFNSREENAAVIGAVGEARWTYAVSKLAGEHLAHAYFAERGVPTVVLRPFNVYGPGQVGEGALSRFVQAAIGERPIEIHNDGTQIRAWCYIDDMVRAVVSSIQHPKAVGQSFNVGNARAVLTIYGLANTVIRVLRSKSDIRFVRRDFVDVELRVPNVGKARDLIGFEAEVSLEEGIKRTAEFYRSQQSCV